jgi:hypothetical protein
VFLVSAPLTLGIGLVADPLVRIALGAQWLGAIPLIQVLCVGEFLRLITAAASPIYIATGRPHYTMVLFAGSAIVMVPLLIFATERAGVLGAEDVRLGEGDAWAVLVHRKAQCDPEDRTGHYARYQRPVIAPEKGERHRNTDWSELTDDHKHQISMER